MIELNLLPDELKIKRKQSVEWQELPIVPVIAWVTVGVIFLHAASVAVVEMNKKYLNTLKEEWGSYEPKRKELDSLKKKVEDVNAKVKAIDELTEGRLIWAKKINSVSDSMLPNIWLSTFSYSDEGNKAVLLLEGYVSGGSEEGTASVGRFINSLKKNENFFSDFEEVELEDIKRSMVEKQEVMKFRLRCPFKKKG